MTVMIDSLRNAIGSRVRIDRNELSGAFGDIGTDLPLIIGLLIVSGLNPVNVFLLFGLSQIFSGLVYGLPMPIQPLKAVAIIAISQNLGSDMILAAGISLGIVMLILNKTGLIKYVYGLIPECVIRGIQFGLGVNLIFLALLKYIPSQGLNGIILAVVGLSAVCLLLGNRRFPPAVVVILLGILYSLVFNADAGPVFTGFHFPSPDIYVPSLNEMAAAFLVLGLPQLPLSLSNSLIATKKLSDDLFPDKKLTISKLANTYSVMNMVVPALGGIPTCHGSGGLSGHYAFGGRTGGTLIIYGALFLALGIFFAGDVGSIQALFPLPVLGVILTVEGFTLSRLIKKTSGAKELFIAFVVGSICVGVKGGYAYALLAGALIYYLEPYISGRFFVARNDN